MARLGILLPDESKSLLPPVFDEHFLDAFAVACWLNFSVDHQAHIMRAIMLLGCVITWGTGCSGTDSPAWALASLQAALLTMAQVSLTTRHIFSAELEPFKQQFIAQLQWGAPLYLFRDLFDLSRQSATCLLSGCLVQPLTLGVQLFMAGFSCKSASFLNWRESGAVADAQSGGTTAITFRGVLCVLARTKPLLVVCENVQGLLLDGQLDYCTRKMARLGYKISWRLLSPHQYGLPQQRVRVYILGIRQDALQPTVTDVSFQAATDELFDASMQSHAEVPLEAFLLPESDPLVACRKHLFMTTTPVNSGSCKTESRWVNKHWDLGLTRSTTHWHGNSTFAAPEFAHHSARVQELLDGYDVRFGSSVHTGRVLNLSQTEASIGIGTVPTLTPNGIYWLEDRGRTLTGYEKLLCQLLHCDRSICDKFSDKQLGDLAGNAFSCGNCVPVLWVLLGLYGRFGVPGLGQRATQASAGPVRHAQSFEANKRARQSSFDSAQGVSQGWLDAPF